MGEFEEVGNTVREFADEDATIIVGSVFDAEASDQLRVTVVATGLEFPAAKTGPRGLVPHDFKPIDGRPDYDSLGNELITRVEVSWPSKMKYRGVDCVVDPSIPKGECYFLNENYLNMYHSRKANFGFTGFKAPVNQDAKTGHILWMGQLTTNNRNKAVGRMYGLPVDYTTVTSE